jgi:hypothetical protein
MKTRGIILIIIGILGSIFVCVFDTIVGKPVNDITGPKSISMLVFCGILIIIGIRFLLKKPKG